MYARSAQAIERAVRIEPQNPRSRSVPDTAGPPDDYRSVAVRSAVRSDEARMSEQSRMAHIQCNYSEHSNQ
jgi:hypothetical protein